MVKIYNQFGNQIKMDQVKRSPARIYLAIIYLLFIAGVLSTQDIIAQNIGNLGVSTNASAAFSFRKLNNTYTGAAMRVRRSTDDAEMNVAFDVTGYVTNTSTVTLVSGVTLLTLPNFNLRSGTIAAVAGSSAVTGIGSVFTSEVAVGDMLVDNASKTTIGIVASIISNNSLTLVASAAISSTGTGLFSSAAGTRLLNTAFTGAVGRLHTWYDQSGNGRDASMAGSKNSQPWVISNNALLTYSGKASVIFRSNTQYLQCNTSTTVQTVSAVRNLVSIIPGDYQTLFASPANTDFSIREGYASAVNSNDWVGGTGPNYTNWVNGIQTLNGTTFLHTLVATTATPVNNSFSISTTFNNRGIYGDKGVSEMILFPSTLPTNERQTIECSQLNYFSISNVLLNITNQTRTICSGASISVSPTAANITYTWGAPVISPAGAITGGQAQLTPIAVINQHLVNNTGNPATATYTVTPSICGTNGNPFTVTVTVNPLPAAPNITADYCTGNGFVKLTSSTGSAYLWSTGQTTPDINVSSAGVYSVLTSTNAYGCASGASINVAQELVKNGNFDSGYYGFNTTYIYDPINLVPEGNFTVGTDANLTNGSFHGKDHTTGNGNFMIVNGKDITAGLLVWGQNNIPVQPNTTYYFSAWGLSLTNGNNAVLQFSINGLQTGSIAYLPNGYTNNSGPYTWVRFFGQWNSGPSTTANISIVNLNFVPLGNDFGLDDISFGTLSPTAFNAVPTSNSNGPVCQSDTLYLNSNVTGGASPYIYAWSGPNAFSSNLPNPVVTNTAGIVNNGVYNLTVTDGFGCQFTASTTVGITALPADKVPAALASTLCAGNSTSIEVPSSENGVSYQLVDNSNLPVGVPVAGTGATVSMPTGLLNTSSTFNVVASNNAGCTFQLSTPVTVTTAATPVLKITNQAACSGTVDLTAPAVTAGSTGSGTLSYWTDPAATIPLASPSAVAASGKYFILSTIGSCSDIDTVFVSINATPSAGIDYATPFCSTGINPLPNYVSGGVAGYFSSTSGLVFASNSTGEINLAASTPGTYTITNTVSPGCTTVTATKVITITAKPKADFSYSTNGLCQSINVANQAPVFGPGAIAGSFASTFGLSYNTGTGVINIGASTPGNYAIWNTIPAANGCPAVADTVFIDINPYTNNGTVFASASDSSICNGQSINLYSVPLPYLSALLREGFNSLGLGWTKQNASTGGTPAAADWTIRPNGYDDGTGVFNSNDNSSFYFTSSKFQGAGSNTNVTLRSAAMSTVGFSTLNLDFFHYFNRAASGIATVEVSLNNATWTSVATFNNTQGARNAFVNSSINLNAYIGQPVFYVRFKYTASFDGSWAIDNISITGNSTNYNYSWSSFPSGFASTLGNPAGVMPSANSFYILTATNSYGCSQPATPVPVTVIPSQTLSGVSQPSIGCIGSGAAITLSGLVPSSISTVNYSIGGIAQAPVTNVVADPSGSATFTSTTLSAANNGQTLMITGISNGTCPRTFSQSIVISVLQQVTWQGAVSSDWFDAQNWCGGVPGATTNILIPATAINFPLVNTAGATVKDITIQAGATVTIDAGGVISISGNIVNGGIFNAQAGTVEMKGTTLQTISGGSFQNNTLGGLVASNTAGVTIASGTTNGLKVADSIAFGAGFSNVNLVTNDNLVLLSTPANTARVADITNGGNSTNNKFTGKVTVERYFNDRRAWRLVTAPLSATGNVYTNWQNSGQYVPGRGVLVSGPNPSVANGLDPSVQNNISLKTGANLVGVTNTKTFNLSNSTGQADNIGYFLFVRGDRDPANTDVSNSTATTISAKGTLQTGTQTFVASPFKDSFALIGNPYASPVAMKNIGRNNIANRFIIWDPNLNLVGGYVVVEDPLNNGHYIYTPQSAGGQDSVIQSGQAFFVQTAANGPASLVFHETDKSVKNNTAIFRTVGPSRNLPIISLRMNLCLVNGNKAPLLVDGAYAEFNRQGIAAIDGNDALKFYNVNEMLSLRRSNTLLAVERRPLLKDNDTLYLQLDRVTPHTYRFQFIPGNLEATLTAFLEDSFTGKATPVSVNDTSFADFVITADARSFAADRFRIVFKRRVEMPVTINQGLNSAFKIYPNPASNNRIGVEFRDMPGGIYNARLLNNMGQTMALKKINHAAGSSLENLTIDQKLAAGIYQLELTTPGRETVVLKVIVK